MVIHITNCHFKRGIPDKGKAKTEKKNSRGCIDKISDLNEKEKRTKRKMWKRRQS